ncbi:MAG: hypothetical protein ACOZHQ_11195 [Thermodesulfobacteriota bacterium]
MRRLHIALMFGIAALLLAGVPAGAALEEGHSIAKVKFAGAEVHLEDGSVWKVPNRADWETTYNWLPGQPVAVRDGKALLNLNTGDEVDVKRIKAAAPKAATPDKPAGQALAKPGTAPAAPRAAAPAVAPAALGNLERRVEALEDKLQVMDWRLRRIEDLLKARPQP